MRKGFNIEDGNYMCICTCGHTFFSDNKRDLVCPECAKQPYEWYQVQRLINKGHWVDIDGLRSSDSEKTLTTCKHLRQNDVKNLYRVVKIAVEVLPLP